MPKDYFPPLPQKAATGDMPLDQLLQEVQRRVNTFYRTVSFQGNLFSNNWNGDAPPGVGDPSDATAGFYLNAEDGIIQLISAFIDSIVWVDSDDGTRVGDLGAVNSVTGDFNGVGLFLDASSDQFRIYFNGSEAFRVTSSGVELGVGGWQDWTPTLTNLNVGSAGVVVAKYVQIEDTVHAHFRATLGGTGISVGDVRVSLPVEMGAALNLEPLGPCLLRDTGTATVAGVIEVVNTTSVVFREYNVSGSLIVTAAISSTSPFTWVAGDILAFNITYEAA